MRPRYSEKEHKNGIKLLTAAICSQPENLICLNQVIGENVSDRNITLSCPRALGRSMQYIPWDNILLCQVLRTHSSPVRQECKSSFEVWNEIPSGFFVQSIMMHNFPLCLHPFPLWCISSEKSHGLSHWQLVNMNQEWLILWVATKLEGETSTSTRHFG